MNDIKIEVLGSGCASCKKLFESTKKAVVEMNMDTEVEYVTDIQKIIEMGVMSSPVLALNGKPVMAGEVPDVEKIKEILILKISDLKPENGKACCSDEKTDRSCQGCC